MGDNPNLNDDGLTFDQWYASVDRLVVQTAGVGIDDLADGPSWDCWHDGYSAREYAMERLDDEGFPVEFDLTDWNP